MKKPNPNYVYALARLRAAWITQFGNLNVDALDFITVEDTRVWRRFLIHSYALIKISIRQDLEDITHESVNLVIQDDTLLIESFATSGGEFSETRAALVDIPNTDKIRRLTMILLMLNYMRIVIPKRLEKLPRQWQAYITRH